MRVDRSLLESWIEELTERVSQLNPALLIKSLAFLERHFAVPADLEQAVIEQVRYRRSQLSGKEVCGFLRLRPEGQGRDWFSVAGLMLGEMEQSLDKLDLEELLTFQSAHRFICQTKNKKLPSSYELAGDLVVRELRAVEKGLRELQVEDMQTLNGLLEAVFHSDCDRDFWKKHIERQIEDILQPSRSAAPNPLELVPFYFNLSRIVGFTTSKALQRLLRAILGSPQPVLMAFLDLVKSHLGVLRGNPEVTTAVRSLAKREDREVRVYAEAVAHLLL